MRCREETLFYCQLANCLDFALNSLFWGRHDQIAHKSAPLYDYNEHVYSSNKTDRKTQQDNVSRRIIIRIIFTL